ncbi:MAG: 2OG-Fe(II) oxygenase [Candidatus Sulfotelmatobacter sp.]|jgi:Rps23 Pro-64 3,4-dihydroxylase Tpa1-like proline 4-hydroxylase
MTPKQILDSFSETLMRDERILSAQERALLATLLQHAKTATGENLETQEAVRAVIASAVGETVAQRAFAVLGGSIVERLLEDSALPLADSAGVRMPDIFAGPKNPGEPQPPSQGPGPGVKVPHKAPQPPSSPMRTPGEPQPPSQGPGPGVKVPQKAPQPPGAPMRTPGEPQPPSTGPGPGVRAPQKEPQPPSSVRTTVVSETSTAIAERPAALPAKCVVLDEFLAPQELEELTRFTIEHEADFSASEVVSPSADGGIVNYEHRRSRVLMDLAHHQDLMLARIKAMLPQVLDKLGMEEFSIADVEVQLTASNDGDFFHFHSDNGSDRVASRHLTFVYFFHREPRQFEGGELRIHDARLEGGTYVSEGSYQTIVPQQNQIVFFPCELLHEITPVSCASQLFADSRFTLNGWLRR